MIITNVHTQEHLESWEFKVQSEPVDGPDIDPNNPTSGKELKHIQMEVSTVMRQIASTVSYLPLIDCICSFDILIHTLKDCQVPEQWSETANITIQNAQAVSLRSFSTGLHKMDTVVNYKMNN